MHRQREHHLTPGSARLARRRLRRRSVAGDPLHRVHECVFGVLALESQPVDPRL
ncbi:MAG: hypothetical protein M3063_02810 [Actinomycetota bacterium]|nr:hypothetical protein [Actinomycetota bacterium]